MSQTYVCDFEMRPLLIDTIVEQNFTRKRVGDAQSINYYDILHTVPYGPLCHALTCTHTYSPLQSTLPSLGVHSAVLSCVLKLHSRQSTYVTHRLRNLYQIIDVTSPQ